ncbi:hypothetical protein GCM10010302_23540 [Streptomyces polychromogenes]|uniref:Gram-positive cocci surface proteins LPxTG domain-containing protein n=1 Tax=Streptomyces polychromogenes TaxID=67342 RepID=A0ABN0VBC7_9ACTN
MKLKRMAVVAAAAVVGPTVLMATPAMADEAKNTAVTTPDSAPKGDSAAAETPAPAADTAKPAVETPAAKPAAETPAKDAKPAPETPAKPSADKPASKETAEDESGDEWQATGPKLDVKGLPGSFTAGGGWQEFSLHVNNKGGKDLEDYSLGLNLMTHTNFKGDYVSFEAWVENEHGKWGWQPVEVEGSEESYGLYIGTGSIAKNDAFDVKLRLKFSKDATPTQFGLWTVGWSNVKGENIYSESTGARSEIKAAANQGGGNTGGHTGGNTGGNHNGGGNTGGGNDTKPNGGGTTTPIVDHNTGTGTGTGTTAGGELAETGTDAATSWALGAGGVALAMGAALVAGTGRRRRVTN